MQIFDILSRSRAPLPGGRGLSALFAFLFVLVFTASLPVFAQETTEPIPLIEEQVNALDASLGAIESLRKTIADLEKRGEGAEGLVRQVFDSRLSRSRLELMQQGLTFSSEIASLVEKNVDPGAYRDRAIEILRDQTSETRSMEANLRQRIALPDAAAPATEQAAAYSRIFESLDELDQSYQIYIDSLKLLREFGVDVDAEEAKIKQELGERAETSVALLDITLSDLLALRAALTASPEDAETKARVNVANGNVTQLAEYQSQILELMEALEIDTTAYREQLLTVTGQITSDFFEINVFSNLLVGWGETLLDGLIDNGPTLLFKVILLVVIIAIFLKLANLARGLVERALKNSEKKLSLLLQRMVLLVVHNAIIVIGVLIALAQIGISLGPLLAGLGVVGFIIGFALQDTLSNFAAGMLILIYRPFDVDDFVEAGGVSGMVSNMSLVNTTILTFDNQKIIVPNNKIWGDVIRNVTAQEIRRVDLVFGISYSDDIPKTEKVLAEIVAAHDTVLDEPETMIRLHELGDSSVNFIVRPWVRTEDYWETYWSIMRTVKLRFDEEGISIPFPQRDVHLFQEQT